MKKIDKISISILFIILSTCVSASGTIQSESGTIEIKPTTWLLLNPQTSVVAPAIDSGYNLGDEIRKWSSIYVNIVHSSSFRPVSNNIYFDNYWGNDNTNIVFQSPPAYPITSMLKQGGNSSRTISFIVDPVSTNRNGLIFSVVGNDDQKIIPATGNTYDLGDTNYYWKSIFLSEIRFIPRSDIPTCSNGLIYYNTANELKFCQNGVWKTIQLT
ncbi:MAG: hypothetical protein KKG04_01715 [Candidatus Thermoplasmatota archaeon]|nr:hypothetical protein [Candidatus Thermoplasmatota archaeon]